MRLAGGAAMIAALVLPAPALADTLLDNVEGVSFDLAGNVERVTGIVIGPDGRILQVLHPGEKSGRVDYRIDGKGRFVMPGLVDGHANLAALGFAALTLDLSESRTVEEAQGRVAAYAAAHSDRPWILGRGWDGARFGRVPTAADLDAAVKDRPIWLASADGHSGWANAAALAAAGITAASKAPPGGVIERMAGGKPSGILRETAMALVEKAVPPPRPEDRDLALAAAQEILLKRGVTTVSAMGLTIEDWQALRRAGDAGRLQLRVIGYAADVEAMSLIGGPGPSPWLYDDRLKLNGVALVLDGAPFTPGEWSRIGGGTARLGQTQLRNLMSRAGIDRFQVAVEAHGDAAVSAALDAVGELAQTYRGERRWRIVGAERVDPADAARVGADTAVTFEPTGAGDPWPAPMVLRAGGRLAFGSGTPAGAGNPFALIATALGRRGADGEGLRREQVLAGWTAGAAWAGMAETRVGRLVPGLRADFVLLDRDPLMASVGELAATRVVATWIGGRKAFGE